MKGIGTIDGYHHPPPLSPPLPPSPHPSLLTGEAPSTRVRTGTGKSTEKAKPTMTHTGMCVPHQNYVLHVSHALCVCMWCRYVWFECSLELEPEREEQTKGIGTPEGRVRRKSLGQTQWGQKRVLARSRDTHRCSHERAQDRTSVGRVRRKSLGQTLWWRKRCLAHSRVAQRSSHKQT